MRIASSENLRHTISRVLKWLKSHPSGLILIVFLFHAVNTTLFVTLDRAPPNPDEAFYFEQSWNYMMGLPQDAFHPPLMQILSIPFYPIFGYSLDVAILSTLPAALVLIFSVYHIGKELKDSKAGLTAAALTVLLPEVFGLSRTYFQELTLMATVAFSLALLLKTRHFSHNYYTLAFGASITLGMLARWTYPLFVLGPFFVYVYQSYREMRRISRNLKGECLHRGKWVLLSVGAGILLSTLWYFHRVGDIATYWRWSACSMTHCAEIAPLVPRAIYLVLLAKVQLGIPFFVLASISVGSLIITRKTWSATGFLLSWILPAFFIFTFEVPQVFTRYVSPYLPAFALIIAIPLARMRPSLRNIIIPVLLMFALGQYFMLSYFRAPVVPIERVFSGAAGYDKANWRFPEVISTLNALLNKNPNATILILEPCIYCPQTINYLRFQGHITSAPAVIFTYPIHNLWDFTSFDGVDSLYSADIVIVHLLGPPLLIRKDEFPPEGGGAPRVMFTLIKDLSLPDGGHVRFYEQGKNITALGEPVVLEASWLSKSGVYYNDYSRNLIIWPRSEIGQRVRLFNCLQEVGLLYPFLTYNVSPCEGIRTDCAGNKNSLEELLADSVIVVLGGGNNINPPWSFRHFVISEDIPLEVYLKYPDPGQTLRESDDLESAISIKLPQCLGSDTAAPQKSDAG